MKDSLTSTNTSYHILLVDNFYFTLVQLLTSLFIAMFSENPYSLVNSGSPKVPVELLGCLALGDVPALMARKEGEAEVGMITE